jgi:Cys-rich repeat protein
MCGSPCPNLWIISDCTTPSDCTDPARPKCCGVGLKGSASDADAPLPAGGGVQCVAVCPADSSITFCVSNADCPAGQTCKAGQGAGSSVKQCG